MSTEAVPARRGVRLALDWGTVRVGVAACDPQGILAYPVSVLQVSPAIFATIGNLVAEYDAVEVIVGLPLSLDGSEGLAAKRIRDVVASLKQSVKVPIRGLDERLTTVAASNQLRAAGRSAKQQRRLIDAAAAVNLLDAALRAERASGFTAGNIL